MNIKENHNIDIKEYIDLSFIELWQKYLFIVQNILIENTKHWNQHVVISDIPLTSEERNERTKRSDYHIIIPTLFLFYHGIEITLKWIATLQKREFHITHSLTSLYWETKKNHENKELIDKLEKYIIKEKMENNLLKKFLNKNNKNIDDFYIFLKYPVDKDNKEIYNYIPLKYLEEEILPFTTQLIKDIDSIMEWTTSIYRRYKDQ